MIFSIAVYAAPFSSQASYSALRFAKALVAEGHQLYRVFFYQDAIHVASRLSAPPQDEINFLHEWVSLKEHHSVDLVVCIAAALKRGLLDEREANRYEKTAYNIDPNFTLSGLGQLVDAAVISDRLLSFGG